MRRGCQILGVRFLWPRPRLDPAPAVDAHGFCDRA